MTTTVTKTIKSSGGDYTSLSAWESANAADLTSVDEIRQAECHNFVDTAMVDIDGWTTDATRYIRIYAAQNHGGVYGTSSYRLAPADTGWSFINRENYCRVEGLCISTTATCQTVFYHYASGTADCRYDRVIVKGTANVTYGVRNGNSGLATYTNILIYDVRGGASRSFYHEIGTSNCYNCTAINSSTGFRQDSGTCVVKNCAYYSQGAPTPNGYDGNWGSGSTNNASDQASDAPGTNPRNSVTPTFVDETNDDFHLASGDTAWKDQGADLSGTFTVDIDNVTRSGTWDIGADEYTAPAVSAAITGTAQPTSTEAQIVAGGRTIIITLTGDTWVASGSTFDAQRSAIIQGLDSAQSEGTGWNAEVRDKAPVTDVVRTSDTVVTITLSAQAGYNITATETITVTVPGAALTGNNPVTATPTFTVTAVSAGKFPFAAIFGG